MSLLDHVNWPYVHRTLLGAIFPMPDKMTPEDQDRAAKALEDQDRAAKALEDQDRAAKALEDQDRAAKALEESRRQVAEQEKKHKPDPNEPTGPHLKTGYGLTGG